MSHNCPTLPWYVIHTLPRRELFVTSLLSRYTEVTFFLPEILQYTKHKKVLVPLFPRYLFVHVELMSSAATRLRHTPGVLTFVECEGMPLPIAEEKVRLLQERIVRINAQGGLVSHSFHTGDPVVINNGPFQGLDAVFVGPMHPKERVQVLLHFLGQQRQVTVDVNLLEKGNSLPRSRPRRTRGQGRWIKTQAAT